MPKRVINATLGHQPLSRLLDVLHAADLHAG